MNESLTQTAGRSAYANGLLSITSTVTILLFFVLGGFWGPLNDANSVIWALTFVPILLMFCQLHQLAHWWLATMAAIVGIMATLTFAFLQVLLVIGAVTFEQTFLAVVTLMAVLGGTLLVYGLLARKERTLSARLVWMTVLYGLSFMFGGLGFWLGGWEHPLAAGGFLVGALLGPVWGIWLGRTWLPGRVQAAVSARVAAR